MYQFHRDTKVSELVGEAVIVRESVEAAGGGEAEVVRQRTEPGGIATADICVLDDITRAPGEALNALLRLLNERKTADGSSIPLCTAIATANPARADYYNEPLDPSNLDRFALQLRTDGLVHDQAWEHAARVISENLTGPPSPAADEAGSGSESRPPRIDLDDMSAEDAVDLSSVHDALPWVALPRPIIGGLVELLRRLVETHGCTERNSLLTDRTFLAKAPRILQARALLSGRTKVTGGYTRSAHRNPQFPKALFSDVACECSGRPARAIIPHDIPSTAARARRDRRDYRRSRG